MAPSLSLDLLIFVQVDGHITNFAPEIRAFPAGGFDESGRVEAVTTFTDGTTSLIQFALS
jgi:hypothetical protein